MKIQKRYQYFGKDGVTWTNWFDYIGKSRDKIQLKGRTILYNEYREVEK